MKRIAVLLTCFNRKDKTLTCLHHLFNAYESYKSIFYVSVYLTDDKCVDGTPEAVLREFLDKDIHILTGTGSLYWAGGMRNSWKEALKCSYDGYLLLNDDTYVFNNLFKEIQDTHIYCLKHFNAEGIYIGTTCSPENQDEITYGGSVIINRWKVTEKKVIPNGKIPQKCDRGNANIMYVTSGAVQKLGILHDSFTHGLADYDYTLTANSKGVPVLITPNICGTCDYDHPSYYGVFLKKNLVNRIRFTYSPLGLNLPDQLIYIRRNFWYRLPFVAVLGWFKILFPSIYLFLDKRFR